MQASLDHYMLHKGCDSRFTAWLCQKLDDLHAERYAWTSKALENREGMAIAGIKLT